jgi:GRAM domain-containing protein 4
MGMISLTPSALLFYPVMSSNAKVTIPLQDIRGVKKAGRMGGLRVKYVVKDDSTSLAPITSASPRQSLDDRGSILVGLTGKNPAAGSTVSINASTIPSALNGEPLEKEEKFGWVSGRDVLFAKLVGWGGRRWVKL